MENNSDSVLEMYLYETNTLLEQLDNIMLSAEQADTLSEDDVNEIFRIMHTLKGSAAMMEFEPLMTIAHRIEDLFTSSAKDDGHHPGAGSSAVV